MGKLMAIESELKLRVTVEQIARLKRQFRKHQISKSVTRRLHNVYFDTPELDLNQRNMALRLRRVGGKWFQTLKGGGDVRAGLHQRDEWEFQVPDARIEFSLFKEALTEEDFPTHLREKLNPVFTTDFNRTSFLIDWQGARIEVCIDRGEIKTDQCAEPICEVEMELKSGEPRQLFELALTLLDIAPLELESVSKAEKGFRLLTDFVLQPVRAEFPKLAQSDSLTDSLDTFIWSCLRHLQENLQGAILGVDPEYLHQMRVALRRLRVLMRISKKMHADSESEELCNVLSMLGKNLGQAREWDVFATQTLALLPEKLGKRAIAACALEQRRELYARIQFFEIQRLLLKFAIWMTGDGRRHVKQCETKVNEFANRHLRQLHKRYLHIRSANREASQLHALRIQAKKLRYSAEFFSAWYDKHKVKSFLAALSNVQELLGSLHDIYIAKRLLDEMVLPRHVNSIASFKVSLDGELSEKLKILERELEKFDRQAVFWK